ncbi:MAG: arabinofuranosyltransferase [Micromonosporaceae bacterium]
MSIADRAAPARPVDEPVAEPVAVRRAWVKSASFAAFVTWLASLPLALTVPDLIGANPFSVRGATLPVATGAAAWAVLLILLWRRASDTVVGVLAGAYAAWVAFVMTCALVGTPYGYGGLTGDSLRISAMATRYSTLWHTAEPVIPGLAGEYPPLFPWLIGRVAELTGVPAWRLIAPAEAVALSAAVVVGFVLWRRFLPAWAALVTVVLGLAVFSDPRKGYEIVALLAFVPLVLAAFATTPRRRLHWLPAGLLGGVMVLTYWGYLVFGGLGLAAVAVSTWRHSPDRRAFLGYVLRVVGVAALVSSWYTVPLLVDLLTLTPAPVSDLYDSLSISTSPIPLPFLSGSLLGVAELVGLVGLFAYRQRTWWARPLLLLLGGAYAYVLIGLLRFAATGHTQLVHYVARLIGVVLVAAAVFTVLELVPQVVERAGAAPSRQAGVAALAIVLVWTGLRAGSAWEPPTVRTSQAPAQVADAARTFANAAHVEPLPDGSLPRFAAPEAAARWFPVEPIRREVAARLGPDARPVTLSVDDRLFSILPWYGYISADRTSSSTFGRFDDRHAELVRQTRLDPAQFAAESARTPFGNIDVFVLRQNGDNLVWRDITFARAQFDAAYFDVVTLPHGYLMAIRKV